MSERAEIEGRLKVLAKEIEALPTPEKLRLAAGLLEAGRTELAAQVIERARLDVVALSLKEGVRL